MLPGSKFGVNALVDESREMAGPAGGGKEKERINEKSAVALEPVEVLMLDRPTFVRLCTAGGGGGVGDATTWKKLHGPQGGFNSSSQHSLRKDGSAILLQQVGGGAEP